MGMHKTTYLMLGIRMPASEFPGDRYDEEWLPYVEGHPGVEMSILSGESDDYLYIGKQLADSGYAQDDVYFQLDPVGSYTQTQEDVDRFLRERVNWAGGPARFMFFDLWG